MQRIGGSSALPIKQDRIIQNAAGLSPVNSRLHHMSVSNEVAEPGGDPVADLLRGGQALIGKNHDEACAHESVRWQ